MSERKIATAIGYDQESDRAPKLLAKGQGLIAENIIETARVHDKPVYEDPRLSQQLFNLKIGDSIPESLYEVVAEVLVFISKMDQRYKK